MSSRRLAEPGATSAGPSRPKRPFQTWALRPEPAASSRSGRAPVGCAGSAGASGRNIPPRPLRMHAPPAALQTPESTQRLPAERRPRPKAQSFELSSGLLLRRQLLADGFFQFAQARFDFRDPSLVLQV